MESGGTRSTGDQGANGRNRPLRASFQRALWAVAFWALAAAVLVGGAAFGVARSPQPPLVPLVAAVVALAVWLLLVRILIHRVARRLARPVELLLAAAQELAAGRLKEDITFTGTEEHVQLARTLNRLRTLLAMAEVKFRTLFAHTSNHIVLLDPDTHVIVDANRAFEHLVRRKRRDLIGMAFLDLFGDDQKATLAQALAAAEQGGSDHREGLLCTLPGEQRLYLDISMNLIQVRTERIIEVSFKDVTESNMRKQELVEIANTDDLTGLYNQRAFHERVPRLMSQCHDESRRLCMLFLDLDNFKRCNDTHGHPVGDELLRRVGRIINENIRRDRDMGFRYGGDEFAILLPRASAAV
ncbi:MAG: diguanylate cyclase, partial [Candidatus Hydrogenedentes bacterium]|nr:diguanylate cyclase [Candidatus Hydrogenedentota bacterium]